MSSIEGIEDPFGPGTAGGTALLEREETQLSEPGDHERFSHYVRKEKILESALTGEPVRALCVRSGRSARGRRAQKAGFLRVRAERCRLRFRSQRGLRCLRSSSCFSLMMRWDTVG